MNWSNLEKSRGIASILNGKKFEFIIWKEYLVLIRSVYPIPDMLNRSKNADCYILNYSA